MPKQFRSDYYEAIIQLRPHREDILAFIQNQILQRNDVFISKIQDLKTGIDIYISSQKFVRSLARRLKSVFRGEVTLSYTLHTEDRQTSKKKYRATLLFRAERNPPEEE